MHPINRAWSSITTPAANRPSLRHSHAAFLVNDSWFITRAGATKPISPAASTLDENEPGSETKETKSEEKDGDSWSMIVFGGLDGSGKALNDIYQYSFTNNTYVTFIH
jgi:hypothetical protein